MYCFYQNPTETQRRVGIAMLLAGFTTIGVFLTDLGFVVSFGGAVLASALVFIFPALMWISKTKADAKNGVVLKVCIYAYVGKSFRTRHWL